jgi:hypothetical protein
MSNSKTESKSRPKPNPPLDSRRHPKSAIAVGRVDELLELAESDATLPNAARAGVKVLSEALDGLDKAIDDLEDEITSAHAQNEMTHLLYKVPGIGKIISSVIAASVPDPSVFKSGRDFAAWLGLTPRQNSSGGKQTLGAITKQGNRYIRKLLVLGATSLLNVMGKRKGALRDWIVGLLAKKPARLVTVALANKLARILWAMMMVLAVLAANLGAQKHDADSRLAHGRARSLVGTTGVCADLDPSNPMTCRDQTPRKSQISRSVGEVGFTAASAAIRARLLGGTILQSRRDRPAGWQEELGAVGLPP